MNQREQQDSTPHPAEVAKVFGEVAERSSNVLGDFLKRHAGGKGVSFADELGIAKAFMDMWAKLAAKGCRFVTRAKKNYLLDDVKKRIDPTPEIFADDLVRLHGKRGLKYPGLLRRIVFYCEETQQTLVFLTNDIDSKAIEIAALYKRRWQIELFFRWIKQNLEMKRFLAKNPNAVRLQIITALIAIEALKLLQQASRTDVPLKRLRALAKCNIFNLCAMENLLRPSPWKPPDQPDDQLLLSFPGQ